MTYFDQNSLTPASIRAQAQAAARQPGPVISRTPQAPVSASAAAPQKEKTMTSPVALNGVRTSPIQHTAPVQQLPTQQTPQAQVVRELAPDPVFQAPRGNAPRAEVPARRQYALPDDAVLRAYLFVVDREASQESMANDGVITVDYTSFLIHNSPEAVDGVAEMAAIMNRISAKTETDSDVFYDFAGVGRFAPPPGQSIPSQVANTGQYYVRGVIGSGGNRNGANSRVPFRRQGQQQ